MKNGRIPPKKHENKQLAAEKEDKARKMEQAMLK